jgi:hypothetical protein
VFDVCVVAGNHSLVSCLALSLRNIRIYIDRTVAQQFLDGQSSRFRLENATD